MTPTSDFSGLMISSCAFASAGAIAPTDSLDRCMAAVQGQDIDGHRPRFRPFRPNAMPGRLLGVLWHEAFELRLGVLMLEVGLARAQKHTGEFGPGVGRAHVDDP